MNDIKKWLKDHSISLWKWFYRWTRGAFAAALAQTLVVACNAEQFDLVVCLTSIQDKWSDPTRAAQTIGVSLLAGFLLALGKALRNEFGDEDRSKGLINRASLL